MEEDILPFDLFEGFLLNLDKKKKKKKLVFLFHVSKHGRFMFLAGWRGMA